MIRFVGLVAAMMLALAGCKPAPDDASGYQPSPYVKIEPPEWSRDAVIYQLNTRQFTSEGTFRAAQQHLPRLAKMGIDIVWLMPIHPIGEVKRKGEMGSPYSVQDYRAINPDLGNEEEFRAFVKEAHRLGMRVILDWVANHSAWDNSLTREHPEWYSRNPEGNMIPPLGTDWSDVADFDYSQAGLRKYMIDSLAFWVREFDIDGYRADVAGFVPLDFWEAARTELDAIKPVFMLAEWETRDLHARAFDATYAWEWKENMQRIVREDSGAGPVRGYYSGQQTTWPQGAYRMVYTDNHDQNSWDGVASAIYGDAYEAAIVLSFVGNGIPLIYNGQEADLDRQLSFFGKDEIIWRDGQYDPLFRKLINLKTEEPALWNGKFGAPMIEVPNTMSDKVFSFIRGDKGNRVFAIFNLSSAAQQVQFQMARHQGAYIDALSDEVIRFGNGDEKTNSLTLAPWGYRVFREADSAQP